MYAFNCLLRYPDALVLYLWYCKEEKYFPGRLIPAGHIRSVAWVTKPFSKEKLVNSARGKLLINGLLRKWINKKTSDVYYQTKFNPFPYNDRVLINFGAPFTPDIIFYTEEELKKYMESHPSLIE